MQNSMHSLYVLNARDSTLPPAAQRSEVIRQVVTRLSLSKKTLKEAIAERDLYFRVSVIANCNLSCQFCHNEGAPLQGWLDLATAERAIRTAADIGFTRVQFTGGEPLLRRDIAEFVAMAHSHVADVGITTNGTFLPRALDGLVIANITRLHVSLQEESLIAAGSDGAWGIPDWLAPAARLAMDGVFALRLNLPVRSESFAEAREFLRLFKSDVKVFSVLPEGNARVAAYPLDELELLVERANAERTEMGIEGRVFLRGFQPPSGIRCPTCPDQVRCKEQSHSLRLGADLTLRPCLATRNWDSPLSLDSLYESVRDAALLSLDYRW